MNNKNQTASPDSASKQREIILITKVLTDAARFQNQKDYEEFSQLFTEDAVIVNIKGIRIIGRDKIYQFMKTAVESFLAEITVENEAVNTTFLRSDVAIVSAIQHIVKKANHEKENLKGSATFVLVNEQGNWLIALGQNTIAEESKYSASNKS
jgi:uncharacterized protein (TIGR02246 family)